MDNFFRFLIDINDNLDVLEKFWDTPHSPETAYLPIETVRIYEETLCEIIAEGAAPDKGKALRAYEELTKYVKNKPYLLEDHFAPEQALEYACNDP